jgi:hypothetical protein
VLLNNVDNQEIACNNFTINGGTSGSTVLNIKSDTDNAGGSAGEADHPSIILHQDGGAVKGKLSMGSSMGDNDLTLENTYAGLILKVGNGTGGTRPYYDIYFKQGSTTIAEINKDGILLPTSGDDIYEGSVVAGNGLFARMLALEASILDLTPSPWLSITAAGGTFAAGFMSHTTTGSTSGNTEAMVRYQKYEPTTGVVFYHIHLKGQVRRSDNGSIGSGTNMFTLPALYRPQKAVYVVANSDASVSTYHSSACHVMMGSGGNFQMRRKILSADPDGSDPAVDNVNLDCVHYFTDNDSNATW